MKKEYTQAVLEMVEIGAKPDTVLSGLSTTMHKRGHIKLYASVLQSILRILEARPAQKVPTVSVAKESDLTAYKNTIAETLTSMGVTESPTIHIDDTLIGGFTVEHDSKRIDQSHKGKLISLYRNIAK